MPLRTNLKVESVESVRHFIHVINGIIHTVRILLSLRSYCYILVLGLRGIQIPRLQWRFQWSFQGRGYMNSG